MQNLTCVGRISAINVALQAGLQWLVNNTVGSKHKVDRLTDSEGTIIRQRYHSERPFDVWSMSIDGVNGCFRQVLSLDTDKTELSKCCILYCKVTNKQAATGIYQNSEATTSHGH